MPIGGVNNNGSDRNYLNTMNGEGNKTNKVYNAVFTTKDDDGLSVQNFFDMMILQLTNQDFMNPVDDTQYLAQMAQFATMQEMMDLAKMSKQNYVMSMLGKQVTITKNVIGGEKKDTVGIVEKIGMRNDEFQIYVDGKPYDLSRVTQVADAPKKEDIGNTGNDDIISNLPDIDDLINSSTPDIGDLIGGNNSDDDLDYELLKASLLADG